MVTTLRKLRKRITPVVRLLSLMTRSCVHVTDRESSFTGLFQITVKLPHEPYKIQVMVGIMSTGVMRLEE